MNHIFTFDDDEHKLILEIIDIALGVNRRDYEDTLVEEDLYMTRRNNLKSLWNKVNPS